MNKNYLGENIRIYRERRNLTQKELGEKIGKTWEMISRYERGSSSALKQLNKLADALKIDPRELLRDSSGTTDNYIVNKIPLFTSIPKEYNFSASNTYVFYPSPDWVIQIDRDSFVIDSSIVGIKVKEIFPTGYLFISPNSELNRDHYALCKTGNSLSVEKYRRSIEDRVIGKILSQEVRFV